LRRYTKAKHQQMVAQSGAIAGLVAVLKRQGLTLVHFSARLERFV
jgi:hypothetical protein